MKKGLYKAAAGLMYEKGRDAAPSLCVKEDQFLSDEIVKIAQRFGVPVVERPDLVRVLRALELDEEIPEELFETVAFVLNEIENKTKR